MLYYDWFYMPVAVYWAQVHLMLEEWDTAPKENGFMLLSLVQRHKNYIVGIKNVGSNLCIFRL